MISSVLQHLRTFAGRHRFWALLIMMLATVIMARTAVLEGYRIADDAMEPSLKRNDYLMANKLVVGFRIPFTEARFLRGRDFRRGDVVVFVYPDDRSKIMVRRIVALPGEWVELRDKKVYVNGAPLSEPYAQFLDKRLIPLELHPRDNRKPVQVPDGSYFVLGDNRDHAYDSRFYGMLRDHDIRGIVAFRYWRGRGVKGDGGGR